MPKFTSVLGTALLLAGAAIAQQPANSIPVRHWPAPSLWQATTPAERAAVRDREAADNRFNPELTSPSGATQYATLVAITPCRLVDTRSNMPTPYGAGASYPTPVTWAASSTTSISVPNAPTGTYTGPGDPTLTPCSLPAAVAYSADITVVPPSGTVFTYLSVCPTGTSTSACSATAALTGYEGNSVFPGNIVSNSTVIPANGAGSFDVWVNSSTEVVIDINGYYVSPTSISLGTGTAAAPSVTFAGDSTSGLYSSGTGTVNVATNGVNRLTVNSNGNVGIGTSSPSYPLDVAGDINFTGRLRTAGTEVFQVFGTDNTAVGYNTLQAVTSLGTDNTAVGYKALLGNQGGTDNTAIGSQALMQMNSGVTNTAVGASALQTSTLGAGNSAFGYEALQNASGNANTGLGQETLKSSTGNSNIAIGYQAGTGLTTGSNNIVIGNSGSNSDTAAIRIGTPGTHSSFYAAGIANVNESADSNAVSVLIDTTTGQLGVNPSSRRYKEDIADMGEASRGLMRLRPVTFRYKKPSADGSKPIQYGLIAEEVADVYPDLVARNADGQIETVKYHVLPAMLLNEVQRQEGTIQTQQRTIDQQQHQIDEQQRQIEELKAKITGLTSLEARLAALESATSGGNR